MAHALIYHSRGTVIAETAAWRSVAADFDDVLRPKPLVLATAL
jgi:hypothetical protein